MKSWQRASQWLWGAFGVRWPSAEQFVAYLQARAAEPCGRTVPASCVKSLIFVEAAGELPEQECISGHPALRNTLEELAVVLGSKDLREVKQAPQLLVAQVIAMECMVLCTAEKRYVRCFAWYKLVKLWGCLRYADTEGMPATALRLEQRGLVGRLDRTKTSGAGKKVAVLHVYISKDAWLTKANWLETGWHLWQEMCDEAGATVRDFFLVRPAEGLVSCTARMAHYSDAAAMSQALFSSLQCCPMRQGLGDKRLLVTGLGPFWTEHSERATLRTWALAARVKKLVCKQLGRWQVSTDAGYVRSLRGNVEAAQARIARAIREGLGGSDFLDEEAVLASLEQRLEKLGFGVDCIQQQLAKLRMFGGRSAEAGECSGTESDSSNGSCSSNSNFSTAEGPVSAHLGRFFVSLPQRTLHKGGECHRVPGLHYGRFIEFDEQPADDVYQRLCSDCFPRGDQRLHESSSDETDSSDAAA